MTAKTPRVSAAPNSRVARSANSKVAKFVTKRIEELASKKNQKDIAAEIGYSTSNVVSMIKMGESKLPIDRVLKFAQALETDPGYLMRIALEQYFEPAHVQQIITMLAKPLTHNQEEILSFLNEVAGDDNPPLTPKLQEALRAAYR